MKKIKNQGGIVKTFTGNKIILSYCIFSIMLISCSQGDKSTNSSDPYSQVPVMCAPLTTDKAWYSSGKDAPLFEGLGSYHYSITTNDSMVQIYFDQGMKLAYGFNHAEAARSFYHAARLDTTCAMAHWGFAYVLGPNYNGGMEPDNYERAYGAIQKALGIPVENITAKERDLIEAMATRYSEEPPEDRSQLDLAYSNALGNLAEKYPEDPTIATLYAESLMNLHPWDLHDKEGNEKEWTPLIINTLESALELDSLHPGAHHMYIHAVEASSTPERGYRSAKVFDDGLMANSGHLVHMPSHIYIRTGDYHKGSQANINAIKVDSHYSTACNAQGVYPLAYYPHNIHFLAATATLEGNKEWAIYAADLVATKADKNLMVEPGWETVQHYFTIPYYVYVKFAAWDQILSIENEVPHLDYPTGVLHYARGMAHLGKQRVDSARSELSALKMIAAKEEMKDITIWELNTVYDLLQIASRVLEAEILASEGNYDESMVLLNEAIEIEDALNYNEPPDWFFSVRHHLGQIQLDAKMYEAAIETYLKDLEYLPKNGWAISGLKEAYRGLNKTDESGAMEKMLELVWATADVELEGSKVKS